MPNNQTEITAEPGKQEIVITREFDASPEMVFKATTDPKLLPQWWGPKGTTLEIDKADIRSGGQWRFIHVDSQGQKNGFHGVYHEVLEPSRVIQTFEWEGLPETGHVILETATFEALPGNRTKLKIQQVFQSVADRDGMVQSGQKGGMEESHARLDEVLATMQKGAK